MTTEATKEELNQIYECAVRIADFPQLVKDLVGKKVPYNITIEILPLDRFLTKEIVNAAKELCLEMEKMGYPISKKDRIEEYTRR